jgi:hypothetical protein
VNLERKKKKKIGVRMSGWWMEKGILILEIIKGSKEEMSGKIEKYERIMYVNGEDVESCRLEKD